MTVLDAGSLAAVASDRCPRTLVLRVMSAVQSVIAPLIPGWRIVPQPTLDMVTEDLQKVGNPALVTPY